MKCTAISHFYMRFYSLYNFILLYISVQSLSFRNYLSLVSNNNKSVYKYIFYICVNVYAHAFTQIHIGRGYFIGYIGIIF